MADLASTKVYGTLDVSDELNVSGEANINQMNGNSSTASKLETARTITINGVISGSTSFDGSSNVTLTTSHTSDPVITLTGDVTGSGTMTNLGNVSITATVADDSHNHIISNVDGLQTALDSKLITSNNLSDLTNAATARSNLGVDASGTVNYSHPTYAGDDINLDTGSLTGATVISDLDFNVTTDTLGHVTDANATYSTRNITLANLGYTGDTNANNYSLPVASTTLGGIKSGTDITVDSSGNVSVNNDSHNHVISNIDGLQTVLDNKLNSSSYTASDVLTKIKTVDGSGSGLDADTLDGQHGSYYSHSISGSKSSATTWTITHNLGQRIVHVTCTDTSYKVISPNEITFTNDNSLTITFDQAIAGNYLITK